MGPLAVKEDGDIDLERMYDHIDFVGPSGAAELIIGETDVCKEGSRETQVVFDWSDTSEAKVAQLRAVSDRIHRYGCKALVELMHTGADGDGVSGFSYEQIMGVRSAFADASSYLHLAGFDGVCVHAGHGWLFTQMLSPLTNHRSDMYGGSVENRARLLMEVLMAIREATDDRFFIEVRFSGSLHMNGGYSIEEAIEFARCIEPYCDMLHVSAGMYQDSVRTWMVTSLFDPHGCNADVALEIKKAVNIPVAVVGGIHTPELAEQILAEGKADMIVMVRQLIRADADWGHKATAGRSDQIRPCIRCMRCFPGPFPEAVRAFGFEKVLEFVLSCTVNPFFNHKDMVHPEPVAQPRRVLVVGGGAAGMQAALTAKERGHEVLLVERADCLGGILNYAEYDADKYDLKRLADALAAMVRASGVEVRTGIAFDASLAGDWRADAVIAAVGSSPALPPIPGLDGSGVLSALDAYKPDAQIGDTVIILGGGQVGCETAVHLAKQGTQVMIVEMADALAKDAYLLHKAKLLDFICGKISHHLGHRCTGVAPGTVTAIAPDASVIQFTADTVISALGMRANPTDDIETAALGVGARYFAVGDCVSPRTIYEALDEAFMTAATL